MKLFDRLRPLLTRPVKPAALCFSLARNRRRLRALRRGLRPGQKLIAIALTGDLGDLVACEPVARHLRAQHPQDYILWICRGGYRELPASQPAVDEVMIVTCLTEWWRLAAENPFDQLIDLHLHGRRCHWFHDAPDPRPDNPAINTGNYLQHGSLLAAFCQSAGLPPLSDAPVVHLPHEMSAAVKNLLPPTPYWVIHTTSNVAEKDWPLEKWRSVLPQLAAETPSLKFVEVGLEPTIAAVNPSVINLCGRLTILELAQVIRQSAGFIGIDSGPAHLANAFARPSVILLGRFHTFDRYQPFTGFFAEHAAEMLLQWNGPVAEIPVEVVLEKFRRLQQTIR